MDCRVVGIAEEYDLDPHDLKERTIDAYGFDFDDQDLRETAEGMVE